MSWEDPNWRPCERRCPYCGCAVEVGEWWDDPPEEGGGHIGEQYRCTACDWTDHC